MTSPDTSYLLRTLALAESRRGFCAPNPAVGAVVVKDGRTLGEGTHFKAGGPHAEVHAINNAGESVEGATIYVSLEPCSFHGRTPACTDLLISKKIARVVYASSDPNPQVSGKGHRLLEEAGIEVSFEDLREAEKFYQSYFYWTKHKRPFATAKLALSLDGKIAGERGEPIKLSGEPLNRLTHQKRKRSDALLTSAHTILADDPQLNARLGEEVFKKNLFILDAHLKTPLESRVFASTGPVTILTARSQDENLIRRFERKGAEVIQVSEKNGHLDLWAVFQLLGERGVHDLWVEAGGTLFAALKKEGLLNRAHLYLCSKWVGKAGVAAFENGGDGLLAEGEVSWEPAGRDVLMTVEY